MKHCKRMFCVVGGLGGWNFETVCCKYFFVIFERIELLLKINCAFLFCDSNQFLNLNEYL